MRRVRIFKQERNAEKPSQWDRVFDCPGTFHAWGCDHEDFETNAGNFSTAIVELDDGTVRNVPADMIEFIVPLPEEVQRAVCCPKCGDHLTWFHAVRGQPTERGCEACKHEWSDTSAEAGA